LDHAFALKVFEDDAQSWLAIDLGGFVIRDIAFFPEHMRNGLLEAGRRHIDAFLVSRLPVPDAGEHIGDEVSHTHAYRYLCCAYQEERVRPGISPRIAASRSLLRANPNLR